MVTAARPLTYQDLLETPEGDGNRYEILAGELIVTASPSKRHAWISFRLARRMADHVEQRSMGVVFHSPVDVRLTRYDVVVPDIIFLSAERRNIFGERFVDGAPDLIVEVLSPSTRSRDLTAKLQLYARTGVQEYWIVDPDTSDVTVYALSAQGAYELVPAVEGRICSRLLPEFELQTADLLSGID
jgi:Uma2 family endonuclease